MGESIFIAPQNHGFCSSSMQARLSPWRLLQLVRILGFVLACQSGLLLPSTLVFDQLLRQVRCHIRSLQALESSALSARLHDLFQTRISATRHRLLEHEPWAHFCECEPLGPLYLFVRLWIALPLHGPIMVEARWRSLIFTAVTCDQTSSR